METALLTPPAVYPRVPLPASTMAMAEKPAQKPEREVIPYRRGYQKEVQRAMRAKLKTDPETTAPEMQAHVREKLGFEMVLSTVERNLKAVRDRLEATAAKKVPAEQPKPDQTSGGDRIAIASAFGEAEIRPIGGGQWAVRLELRSVSRGSAMNYLGQAMTALYPPEV